MRRLLSVVGTIVLLNLFVGSTSAYAQQSLSLFGGGFVPRGEDARIDGDVLRNNLNYYLFDIDRFKSGTIGADYLIAINPWVEAGLGLGVYSKSVPSSYADLVNENGSEIEQRLKLRMVPFTASFRVLPAGRQGPVQPYVGAGVSVVSWRYTETGDFVDFDGFLFHDRFAGSGTSTGPVVLAGVRFPVGAVDIGGEVRHQWGEGKLDPDDFTGATKIDLGGFSYLATVNIRF